MKADLQNFKNILAKNGIKAEPKTKFKNFSLMYDFARGRALKVDYIKKLLKKVAQFGVNEFWFYVEDLIKIKEPFFGYQRGGYSKEEFKELDDYAKTLGIELVFAIQTLGHMEQFIRWPIGGGFADSGSVLMCEDEKVDNLIKKMLKFCKDSFTSTKIHIGLDETWGLARGNYLSKHGLKDPAEVFLHHLNKVRKLAKEIGYKEILLWSDMLITLNGGNYREPNMDKPSKLLKDFKYDGLNLVFWDYYTKDLNILEKSLKTHKMLTDNTTFASGFWIWQRPIVDLALSKETTKVAIESSKNEGVDDICFTLWNDNGGYCNPDDIMIMLPYVSEIIFNLPSGTLAPLYKKLEKIDLSLKEERDIVNSFSYDAMGVLYDDPILGIFLNNYYKFNNKVLLNNIIKLNEFDIEKYKTKDPEFYHLFYILKLKQELRVSLLNNLAKPKELRKLLKDYKFLLKHYEKYQDIFVKNWQKSSKENGLEVHQLRLSGLAKRVSHLISLIEKDEDLTKIIDLPEKPQHIDPRFSRVFPSIYFM